MLWRFLLYFVFSTHELGKRRRWPFFRGTSLALSTELVRSYQPSAASVSEGVELRLVNDIHVSREMFCFQVYTTKCLCCLLEDFFNFDVGFFFLQIQIYCNNTLRYRARPALLFVPKLSSYKCFNNMKTKPNQTKPNQIKTHLFILPRFRCKKERSFIWKFPNVW